MGAISGGVVKRWLPKTTYDFSNIAANQSQGLLLATHNESAAFTAAEVMLRLHAGTTMGAGTQINFIAQADGHDFEDPSTDFHANGFGSVIVAAPVTAPQYFVLGLNGGFGRYVRLLLNATQPAVAATLIVVVSVDIALKGGDPEGVTHAPNATLGYALM